MDRKSLRRAAALIAAGVTLPAAVWRFWQWQRNWGATEDEIPRVMPGDDQVERPDYVRTRAITVDAGPQDIYPWLVQMGKGRGGLYSWDFLDRLFGFLDAPSAKVIHPEWQDLQPGDTIPVGRGGDFPVVDLAENAFLYLGGTNGGVSWTWTTALYPTEDGRTRLVTRNTGKGGVFSRRPVMAVIDLAAFIMVHRWLNVLKGRAEALRREREKARTATAAGLA